MRNWLKSMSVQQTSNGQLISNTLGPTGKPRCPAPGCCNSLQNVQFYGTAKNEWRCASCKIEFLYVEPNTNKPIVIM